MIIDHGHPTAAPGGPHRPFGGGVPGLAPDSDRWLRQVDHGSDLTLAVENDLRAAARYRLNVRPEQDAVATVDLFIYDGAPRSLEGDQALRHFRTTDHPPAVPPGGPSLQGLSRLHLSGSSQFTGPGFGLLTSHLAGKNVYDLDLREESHAFVNGLPVSWFAPENAANRGRDVSWILRDDERLAKSSLRIGHVAYKNELHPSAQRGWAGIALDVHDAETERDLVEKAGWHYVRHPVTDQCRPTPDQVDGFVQWATSLPADAWVHVHCAGGQGRTTTFMAMYDMLRNARQVSFEDILARQHLMGGVNLRPEGTTGNAYRTSQARMRYDFLKSFYQYCRDNDDGYATSYSQWQAGGEAPRPGYPAPASAETKPPERRRSNKQATSAAQA